MNDNAKIPITLQKDIWNKLIEMSEYVGIPIKEEAEILLTLKLAKELPSTEKNLLAAELEAFYPKFSLIIAGLFKRVLKSKKKKAVINQMSSTDSQKISNYAVDIDIPLHQFQKLNHLGIINNSSSSIEASRMITQELKEKFDSKFESK
jgi:hypothetical protein